MIIAVTTWNGGISPVFEVSQKLELFEVENGQVLTQKTLTIPPLSSGEKVDLLVGYGVVVLICGALTRQTEKMIRNHDLELHPFISGKIDAVLNAWHQKELIPTFKMPGCRRRRYSDYANHCCRRGTPIQNKETNLNSLI